MLQVNTDRDENTLTVTLEGHLQNSGKSMSIPTMWYIPITPGRSFTRMIIRSW